jgi:hypothetical protein
MPRARFIKNIVAVYEKERKKKGTGFRGRGAGNAGYRV